MENRSRGQCGTQLRRTGYCKTALFTRKLLIQRERDATRAQRTKHNFIKHCKRNKHHDGITRDDYTVFITVSSAFVSTPSGVRSG